MNDITYIEIQKKDMTIHTIKGNYEIKYSLDKIEEELESCNFFRCHKSFLVNINYIENIRQYVAILENKEEVPISRHRFKEVKSKFLNHLGDVLC
jgi:DNA-binding LytR/AlgR family response regulator